MIFGRDQQFKVLMDCYKRVVDSEPQMIVIRGNTGVGKTRLVQEFYNWLCSQTAPDDTPYWYPINNCDPAIVTPKASGVSSKLPWLWWAITFDNPLYESSSLRARSGLQYGFPDIEPHLTQYEMELRRKDRFKASAESIASTVADGASLGFLSALNNIKNLLGVLKDEISDKNTVALSPDQQAKKIEKEFLTHLMTLLKMALCADGKAKTRLPVFLVVDDAQWADEATCQFLIDLYQDAVRNSLPLFVLVTHWEDHWYTDSRIEYEEQAHYGISQLSLKIQQMVESDVLQPQFLRLQCLKDNAAHQLVQASLEGVTREQSKIIIQRAGGNPAFMLDLARYLKLDVTRWFENGSVREPLNKAGLMAVKELDKLDHIDLQARIFNKLRELDTTLVQVLELAALMGVRFSESVMRKVGSRLGMDAVSILNKIEVAVKLGYLEKLIHEYRFIQTAFYEICLEWTKYDLEKKQAWIEIIIKEIEAIYREKKRLAYKHSSGFKLYGELLRMLGWVIDNGSSRPSPELTLFLAEAHSQVALVKSLEVNLSKGDRKVHSDKALSYLKDYCAGFPPEYDIFEMVDDLTPFILGYDSRCQSYIEERNYSLALADIDSAITFIEKMYASKKYNKGACGFSLSQRLHRRASLYVFLERYTEAIKDLERSLALQKTLEVDQYEKTKISGFGNSPPSPYLPSTLLALGTSYYFNGEFSKAEKSISFAIEIALKRIAEITEANDYPDVLERDIFDWYQKRAGVKNELGDKLGALVDIEAGKKQASMFFKRCENRLVVNSVDSARLTPAVLLKYIFLLRYGASLKWELNEKNSALLDLNTAIERILTLRWATNDIDGHDKWTATHSNILFSMLKERIKILIALQMYDSALEETDYILNNLDQMYIQQLQNDKESLAFIRLEFFSDIYMRRFYLYREREEKDNALTAINLAIDICEKVKPELGRLGKWSDIEQKYYDHLRAERASFRLSI